MTLRCDHCDAELPDDLVDVLVIRLVCGERIVLGRRCCVRGVEGWRQSTIPEREALTAEVAELVGPPRPLPGLPKTAAEVDQALDGVLERIMRKPGV